LKPVPLVADPKLSPTVPIATLINNLSSLRTTRYSSGLVESHESRLRDTIPCKLPKFLLAILFIGLDDTLL
jgi:hypothetical protein